MKFTEVLLAHMYIKHVMEAVVLCYLPLSQVAVRDGVHVNVGSGSQFTGLLL